MSEVLLLKKVRGSRNIWSWVHNDSFGERTAPEGDLELQMGTVFYDLQSSGTIEAGMSVLCPQLGHKELHQFMTELFPEDHFYPLHEHALVAYFERAFNLADGTLMKRTSNKKSTLFISSDASSGGDEYGNHACWAWATEENGDNAYNFGYSGKQDTNSTELEGILHAIVENRDTLHDRIHVFCDSANSVDVIRDELREGIIPSASIKYGFDSLAREAYDVLQEREVEVQWVRGHKNHRLNNAADIISRTASKRYAVGLARTEFGREIKAIHRVFITK